MPRELDAHIAARMDPVDTTRPHTVDDHVVVQPAQALRVVRQRRGVVDGIACGHGVAEPDEDLRRQLQARRGTRHRVAHQPEQARRDRGDVHQQFGNGAGFGARVVEFMFAFLLRCAAARSLATAFALASVISSR
jgi:hypothetical protein